MHQRGAHIACTQKLHVVSRTRRNYMQVLILKFTNPKVKPAKTKIVRRIQIRNGILVEIQIAKLQFVKCQIVNTRIQQIVKSNLGIPFWENANRERVTTNKNNQKGNNDKDENPNMGNNNKKK